MFSETLKLIKRSSREAIWQLWHNKFLSISTIFLGALVIFLLNLIFSLQFFVDYSLQNLEKRTDFAIPLQENYDEFEFEALKNDLKNSEVKLELLESQAVVDFSLPSRLKIQFFNLEKVSEVLNILKKSRYTEVINNWDGDSERDFSIIIDKMISLRQNTQKTALVLIFIFVLGGILLTINNFQLVIFSRKQEIFIARLVGAKPIFITLPFVLEGILLGILASFLSILVFIFLLREITILPTGEIFLYLYNNVFAWEILLASVGFSFGAWFSVQKYLWKKIT